MMFTDRAEAGAILGRKLLSQKIQFDRPVLVGLPGGGIPIAMAAANETGWPVRVVISRKLRSSWNQELAVGALTASGPVYFNDFFGPENHLADVDEEIQRQRLECQRREEIFTEFLIKKSKPPTTPILIDDGIATGATMIAAIRYLKSLGFKRVVCAVPVCSPEIVEKIRDEVTTLISLHEPAFMISVGSYYRAFPHVDENTALKMLRDQKSFLKKSTNTVTLTKKTVAKSADKHQESR